MDDERIAKLAQRLSRWQKLREQTHIPRRLHEWAGSDVYKSQMELLRSVDGYIRDELAGPEGGQQGIKDKLKLAKKALKEQRYPDVIYYIREIDESIQKIINEGSKLQGKADEHIDELFGRSDVGLQKVQERFKQAGVRDWLKGYSQRRTERMLEKAYQVKVKQMRLAMQQIINQTEQIVSEVLNSLKRMAAARIRGDIGQYVGEINRIATAQSQFAQNVTGVYNENIRDMIARIQQRQGVIPAQQPEAPPKDIVSPMGTQPVNVPEDIRGETEPTRTVETADVGVKPSAEAPSTAKGGPANIPQNLPGAAPVAPVIPLGPGYRNALRVTMSDGSIGMSIPKDKFEYLIKNKQLIADKGGNYIKGSRRFPLFTGFENFFDHNGYYKAESVGDRVVLSYISGDISRDVGIPSGRAINRPVQDFEWFKQFNSSNVPMSDRAKEFIGQAAEKLYPQQSALVRENLNLICSQAIDAALTGTLLKYEKKHDRMELIISPRSINIPSTNLWFKWDIVILYAIPERNLLSWYGGVRPVKGIVGGLEEAILDEEKESVKTTSAYNPDIFKVAGYLGGSTLPADFWVKFVQMCQRLEVDPHDLAAVINSESGFNPAARNFAAGKDKSPVAQGFNQLIHGTAKSLGMSDQTWQYLYLMPAEEQLKWVEKYFGKNARGKNAGQLYLLNFGGYKNPDGSIYAGKAAQNAWIAAHPEDAGKFSNPNYQQLAVEQNPGIVTGGKIMPSSLDKLVSRKRGAFKANIDEAIREIGNRPPPPYEPPNPNWVPSNIQEPSESTPIQESAPTPEEGGIEQLISQFLSAAGSVNLEKLPISRVLISISDGEEPYLLRYAKILSTAMRNELSAESGIHYQDGNVEIETDISGSMPNVIRAVSGVSQGISEAFEDMSGAKISVAIRSGKSELPLVDAKTMENGFRKFAEAMNE
jgi:hypothetical protein